jgi:hypothetical protein
MVVSWQAWRDRPFELRRLRAANREIDRAAEAERLARRSAVPEPARPAAEGEPPREATGRAQVRQLFRDAAARHGLRFQESTRGPIWTGSLDDPSGRAVRGRVLGSKTLLALFPDPVALGSELECWTYDVPRHLDAAVDWARTGAWPTIGWTPDKRVDRPAGDTNPDAG